MRSLFISLVVLWSLLVPAYAAVTNAGPAVVSTGANVWEVVYGAGNTLSTTRTWSAGSAAGSAAVTDVVEATIAAGTRVPLSATRTISAAAVAGAAARVLPIVSYASVAYDIWTALRCKVQDGGIVCDPGSAQVDTANYCVQHWAQPSPIMYCGASPLEAGQKYVAAYNNAVKTDVCMGGNPQTFGPTYSVQSVNALVIVIRAQCGSNAPSTYTITASSGTTKACPGGVLASPHDGKCPTGTYQPTDPGKAADIYAQGSPAYGGPGRAPQVLKEATESGITSIPESDTPTVTGPSSVPGPSTTTTVNLGDTVTTNNNYNITYQGNKVTVTTTTNTTTTKADGSSSSSTTTTNKSPLDWLCGLVGMPNCRVSVVEDGTPEWKQPTKKDLEDIQAADAAKMGAVAQTIPEPDLGWFNAPPLAECQPFPFPNNMGSLDACGVVGSVRSMMAYLWSLMAAWMCFGWIRQAVNGG